jgi:hypothetical protein
MPAHLIGRHRQAPVVSECLLLAFSASRDTIFSVSFREIRRSKLAEYEPKLEWLANSLVSMSIIARRGEPYTCDDEIRHIVGWAARPQLFPRGYDSLDSSL